MTDPSDEVYSNKNMKEHSPNSSEGSGELLITEFEGI